MSSLTPRQRRIAELAVVGLSNGEIATALRVTPAVVLAELEALFRQLEGATPDGARPHLDRSDRSERPEGAHQ